MEEKVGLVKGVLKILQRGSGYGRDSTDREDLTRRLIARSSSRRAERNPGRINPDGEAGNAGCLTQQQNRNKSSHISFCPAFRLRICGDPV